MPLQRSHLSLRPAGSSALTVSLTLVARAGRRGQLRKRPAVPRESELDAEGLAGGKRNPAAESQRRLLTEGKNEKRKIPSEQHHASPAAL